MEWSADLTLEFIHLYESHPVLWDAKHRNRKNRTSVMNAWQSIAQEIGVDVDSLKKKKESLMAMYRPIAKKVQNSEVNGLGTNAYVPTWFAFNAMNRFLRPQKIEENWNDSLTVESEESTTCEVPDPIIEVNTENRRFLPPQSTGDILLSQDAQNKRGRVNRDIDSSFGKRLKRASDMLANIASHRAEPVQDSASLYGQLLAIKLRGLSKRTQLVLQNKIDNLVFQAELDEIDSGTCVTPNSVQSP